MRVINMKSYAYSSMFTHYFENAKILRQCVRIGCAY